MTARLTSQRQTLRISQVRTGRLDAGLAVEVLGWSLCRRSCGGGVLWSTSRKIVLESIDGQFPVDLKPGPGIFVVFKLTPTDTSTLIKTCELKLHTVGLVQEGGSTIVVTGPGGYIAAVHVAEPHTARIAHCKGRQFG